MGAGSVKPTRHLAATLMLALVLAHSIAIAAPMQHAFLVQNSGWMEPFYEDQSSQFKPLVGAIATTVARPGDTVAVAAFNQQSDGNRSPALLYSGQDAGQVHAALQSLQVARKASGAFADTDFQEAVASTITGTFSARPGIIWIFTNNRNSPGNDPDTVTRNREFYNLLHMDPSITRSIAFPLRMPVKGKHFQATGLMVYALAYGEAASAHLQGLIDDGTLARIFTATPARLKPLDRDAVRIVPRGVSNSENVRASLGDDKTTLVFDIGASDVDTRISLNAALENLFYPYQIVSAGISASMSTASGSLPVDVSVRTISELAPGDVIDLTLDLAVPQGDVPSAWSLDALAAMGKQVTIPAVVEIRLDGQRLRVADRFRQDVELLFPGDPLSDVFIPPETIQASTARIPVALRVQYPLLPVVLLVGGSLLLIIGLAILAILATRTTRHDVVIDGNKRTVSMKSFSTIELRDPHGAVAGALKRGLGQPRVLSVNEGHSISVPRR